MKFAHVVMRKEPHVITIETLLRPEVRGSFKFRVNFLYNVNGVNATVCLEIYDSEKAINVYLATVREEPGGRLNRFRLYKTPKE